MGRGGDAGEVVGRPLSGLAEPVGRDGFGTGVRVSGGRRGGLSGRGADGAGVVPVLTGGEFRLHRTRVAGDRASVVDGVGGFGRPPHGGRVPEDSSSAADDAGVNGSTGGDPHDRVVLQTPPT